MNLPPTRDKFALTGEFIKSFSAMKGFKIAPNLLKINSNLHFLGR
ncbi:hypothetical protein SPHINGO8BC_150154 [Sphingobacterium multivorum]|uniref:Uncharacterized protein n=1 Tax=Sphingobacterium multivorum TaxID=28454 RepID=A0A654A3B6_SPHMU|nr:hypothetical protein SPHINGO8BC_150154 [Sphingobacterium multivorum]